MNLDLDTIRVFSLMAGGISFFGGDLLQEMEKAADHGPSLLSDVRLSLNDPSSCLGTLVTPSWTRIVLYPAVCPCFLHSFKPPPPLHPHLCWQLAQCYPSFPLCKPVVGQNIALHAVPAHTGFCQPSFLPSWLIQFNFCTTFFNAPQRWNMLY